MNGGDDERAMYSAYTEKKTYPGKSSISFLILHQK
jgi:hypothetical protein